MRDPVKIMYGTHAVQVTVTLPGGESHQQWFCGKCRRIWGRNDHDQHMASWCCCTHKVCDCGKEHEKHWTMCDDCRNKKAAEKWFAKPEVIWDGEFPIACHNSDEYFFDGGSLLDHIHDRLVDDEAVEDVLDSLRLTSCKPNRPRTFEVNEWCGDELAEDGEVSDVDSIDDRINAILGEIGILSWSMKGDRLNVRDVLQRIGYWEQEKAAGK